MNLTDPEFHLLVYSEATGRGGAEIACGTLLQSLDRSIRVTTMGPEREVVEWLAAQRPGSEAVVIRPVVGKGDLAGMRAQRRVISSLRPTIMQANLTHIYACEYTLAIATSIPGVATIAVEHSPNVTPATWARKRLKRWVSGRLAAHVAVGERTAREVEAAIGLPVGSVRTIYNGVPDVAEEPVALRAPGPVIGILARLTEIKRIDTLVRALSTLPGVTLVIVGDGPEEPRLRALAADLGLEDRVVFTGWSDHPRAWLQAFDLYVLPSMEEAVPLSLGEAMLEGLAVVASDVGSVDEIVADGETGILVPPDDVEALASAIRSLLDDDERRRAMGERGRAHVRRDFDMATMVDHYQALYSDISGMEIAGSGTGTSSRRPTSHGPAIPRSRRSAQYNAATDSNADISTDRPPVDVSGDPRSRAPMQEFAFRSSERTSLTATMRETVGYRECIWAFAARSLRVRYAQAALGVGWAVLQPLAFLGVFVVFFGGVAGLGGGGKVGYAAFAIAALVPWQFVSSSVSFGGDALISNSELVRKVYFPREAPVLGTIGSYLPDLAIGIVLALLLAPLTGATLNWNLLYLPLLCAAILVPALALAIPLSAFAVYYRDFKYALPMGVQLWFFASPVAYPVSTIGDGWHWLYALLNPVVGMLEGFRRVLAAGRPPDWGLLGISLASSLVLLLIGLRVFKQLEGEFADVI